MHDISFFKAPRYLMRKYNILNLLHKQHSVKTFVDVGCGAGELDCTLATKGYSGVGIDFSQDAILACKKIQKNRGISESKLKFIKGEIQSLKNIYDVVIACEVLEHVKNDLKLLKQLRNLSSKYVLVSVPAKMKYYDDFDRRVGHYRRYEKTDLIELFNKAGLQVVEFRSYGFPFINLTRLIRKAGARFVKKEATMTESTKKSGINPIKLPAYITKLDLEKPFKVLYWLSIPFNKFNLSEGYLVLAKK